MAFKVFISHSISDVDLVEQLAHWLRQGGIEAYVAEFYPEPGEKLPDKIARAIGKCDCIIALMTYASDRSKWVHQEIGYAKKAGKLIIPIVEEGIELGGFLEGVEYIPFRRYEPYDAITRVVENLNVLTVRKAEQERTQVLVASLMILLGVVAIAASQEK